MRPDSELDLDALQCASLPAPALAVLADLRREPGVTVTVAGDRAWVRWARNRRRSSAGSCPIAGVELYARRDGLWYRHGHHLPTFGLPVDDGGVDAPAPGRHADARPAGTPGGHPPRPVALTLVRDGRVREASALECGLDELGRWAEMAPTARLAALRAAVAGDRVLLLGRRLPPIAGASGSGGDASWCRWASGPSPTCPSRPSAGPWGPPRKSSSCSGRRGRDGAARGLPAADPGRGPARPGGPAHMMTVDDYLAIPEDYCRWLGGLRWCPNGEAVEYATTDPEIGLTFAMSGEIALFLEGSRRRAGSSTSPSSSTCCTCWATGADRPARARGPSQAEFEDLARAFRETGRPMRNAGRSAPCSAATSRACPTRRDSDASAGTERAVADAVRDPADVPRRGAAAGPAEFETLVLEAPAGSRPMT